MRKKNKKHNDWTFKILVHSLQLLCCNTRFLTHWCPAAKADLQHRIQNLKDRRLLMIGQQQNSKVHLWSGVLSIRH